MESKSHMYTNTKTWNVFKGCNFLCTYCTPSFQRQSKRQKNCMKCYHYLPHAHEERLSRIPSAEIIFVCGSADISFCDSILARKIINRIKEHNVRCPYKTYYFQSKRPEYFKEFLTEFPNNVILVTTLESNRKSGYQKISKAPVPTERHRQFKNLEYPRKVVTIEPVMDFDLEIFSKWIVELDPEYVWLGYNSRPTHVKLPEPPIEKLRELVMILTYAGVKIKAKELRGLSLDSMMDDSDEKTAFAAETEPKRELSDSPSPDKRG